MQSAMFGMHDIRHFAKMQGQMRTQGSKVFITWFSPSGGGRLLTDALLFLFFQKLCTNFLCSQHHHLYPRLYRKVNNLGHVEFSELFIIYNNNTQHVTWHLCMICNSTSKAAPEELHPFIDLEFRNYPLLRTGEEQGIPFGRKRELCKDSTAIFNDVVISSTVFMLCWYPRGCRLCTHCINVASVLDWQYLVVETRCNKRSCKHQLHS